MFIFPNVFDGLLFPFFEKATAYSLLVKASNAANALHKSLPYLLKFFYINLYEAILMIGTNQEKQ